MQRTLVVVVSRGGECSLKKEVKDVKLFQFGSIASMGSKQITIGWPPNGHLEAS